MAGASSREIESIIASPPTTTIVMDDSSLPDLIECRKLYIRIAIPIPDNGLVQEQQQRTTYVDVLPNETFADVRTLLSEHFRADMLPPCHEYYFCFYNVRVSKKQETQKRVWAFATDEALHDVRAIANSTVVSIHIRHPR